MEDQPTCGEGLAANAVLPRKLGELTDAVAQILELHMEALDLADEASRAEHVAYEQLARAHRRIAVALTRLSERMAGCRDLPMGRHDVAALSGPEPTEAFKKFVRLEQELDALLRKRLEEDWEMLREMGGAR